eukprot:PhM_4_TR15124/c0_g1_i1/m.22528
MSDVTSVRNLLNRQTSGLGVRTRSALASQDPNAQHTTTTLAGCPPLSARSVSEYSCQQPDSARVSSARSSLGRSSSLSSPQVDRRHRDDPRYAAEYIKDIMDSLFRSEQRLVRDSTYMAQQPELSEKMRMILVDWLVEVHQKFKCRHETLFLAVDVVDRYLAATRTSRATLQLVGVTSMLLA